MRPQTDRNSDDAGASSIRSSNRRAAEARFALRLFALSAALFGTAAALATGLIWWTPPPRPGINTFLVPAAFAFSTTLLILCSAFLQKGLGCVRRERQRKFRSALVVALACGTAFVGVQAFGLLRIVQYLQADRNAGEAQLGATALVLGAAFLHGLHATVALMFLTYVTLRSFNDRYDHEYSFGVAVCTWFWHALGVMWVFILGAYGVVSWFLVLRV